MTGEQLIVFGVLAATLVLFVWNRWRYDLVALGALLACALTGVVPADEVFAGIGHPAVISVAAVLVLSRGLLNAGVVDSVARRLMQVGDRPWAQVAALTGIVALSSGFMNNVGALALFMPVAIWMSRQSGRSPSYLLMPLAFGSLLGGTLTLIGTPPNLIIAGYRAEAGEAPFGMFAFLPVGAAVTVAGVLFIALLGWRLVPRRQEQEGNGDLFEISAYLTEVRVPESCKYAGRTLHALINAVKDEADVQVIALVRGDERQRMPSTYEVLREGDILLVEADSDSLKALLDVTGVELAANVDEHDDEAREERDTTEQIVEQEKARKSHKSRHGELTLAEAIISPGSILVGTTASGLDLRERHGVNVLAVARQGRHSPAAAPRGCSAVDSQQPGLPATGIARPEYHHPAQRTAGQRGLRHHPRNHRLRPAAGCHRAGHRRAGDDPGRVDSRRTHLREHRHAGDRAGGRDAAGRPGAGDQWRLATDRRRPAVGRPVTASGSDAGAADGGGDADLQRGQQCRRRGARRASGDQPGARHGRLGRPLPDGGGDRCLLRLPDAHRASVQHPGDGPGRLPLR